MELLGRANTRGSMSNFIVQCCQLGPSLCQYMWIIDNVCYAVSCREGSDACDPLVIPITDDISSIYFKLTPANGGPSGRGRGHGGEELVGHPDREGGGAGDTGESRGDERGEDEDKHPVADAGPDIVVTFPSETMAVLNGSNSNDDKVRPAAIP